MIKIITDPKLIEELDKQDLYICPSEGEETFDNELLINDRLKKSKDAVGQDSPILVAVWLNDPFRDSKTSEKRVHMRIIEGRHRYKQDKNWVRRYYLIESIEEYWNYRINFGIRKKDNDAELSAQLRSRGNLLYEKGIPREKISAELCKIFPAFSKQKILHLVPLGWKDPKKAANRKGKTIPKNGNTEDEECQEKIDKLTAENQKLKNDLTNSCNTISAMKEHIMRQELGQHN